MTLKSIMAMEGLNRTPRAAEMIEEVTFMLGSAQLLGQKKQTHQAGRRKRAEGKNRERQEQESFWGEQKKKTKNKEFIIFINSSP